MNERIKQLAEQAGFKVNWQHEDVQAIKMARFEKFAELIVRECANVGEQYADGNYEVYNQIMAHFGMEEE
jgi:hypothetical protein